MTRIRRRLALTLLSLARRADPGITFIQITLPLYTRHAGVETEVGSVQVPIAFVGTIKQTKAGQ